MKETITYDDFSKLDIRIGTIETVEPIEGSEKLLRLQINIGEETRQVLAGIAKHIESPESLVGKQTPILVNLEPRKMMGYESQGMILAADNEDTPTLIAPGTLVPAGSVVR